MIPGPSAAFVIAVAGVLSIYVECARPGWIVPGLCGVIALLYGSYSLSRYEPTALGMALIAAALVLFIVEAVYATYFLAGIAATGCLAAGAWTLIEGAQRISPWAAVLLSVVFGVVTGFLGYAAKRARRNKWADVEGYR